MNPLNHQLARGSEKGVEPVAARSATPWWKLAAAFGAMAVVIGNSLRRPLRGDWDFTDLAWSALYALLGGAIGFAYGVWQRQAARQSENNLAVIRGDTLFIYPQPDREQRVPLLGVTEVVQGQSDGASTEIVTERAAAILEARFTLELDAERCAEVVAFANRCLRPGPE